MPAASSVTFWFLMERWHVPDDHALKLIGFEGKPRKRFKLPPSRLARCRPCRRLTAPWNSREWTGRGCITDAAGCDAGRRWNGSRLVRLTRFSGYWPKRRWRRRWDRVLADLLSGEPDFDHLRRIHRLTRVAHERQWQLCVDLG